MRHHTGVVRGILVPEGVEAVGTRLSDVLLHHKAQHQGPVCCPGALPRAASCKRPLMAPARQRCSASQLGQPLWLSWLQILTHHSNAASRAPAGHQQSSVQSPASAGSGAGPEPACWSPHTARAACRKHLYASCPLVCSPPTHLRCISARCSALLHPATTARSCDQLQGCSAPLPQTL